MSSQSNTSSNPRGTSSQNREVYTSSSSPSRRHRDLPPIPSYSSRDFVSSYSKRDEYSSSHQRTETSSRKREVDLSTNTRSTRIRADDRLTPSFTRTSNKEYDRTTLRQEIKCLFDRAVTDCYHYIKPVPDFVLLDERNHEHGDFEFYGVIHICEQFRKKDPEFFKHTKSRDIARKIKKQIRHQNSGMIERVRVRDAGILTFRLKDSWMAEKISKMLKHGIDTWAPQLFLDPKAGGKVVFVFPTIPIIGYDLVRATYLKEAVSNSFIFVGADVGDGYYDPEARRATHHYCAALLSERPLHNVHVDLGTIWTASFKQNANVLVHMTPHWLRGYIRQCHRTAVDKRLLSNLLSKGEGPTCCGFQSFSAEQQQLDGLFKRFISDGTTASARLKKLGASHRYNLKTFFECAFKFTCLKSHRLAECIFKYEDIVDERGNTFASLLKTRTYVCSVSKKYGDRHKLDVLAKKERLLVLHLVEFTEVLYVAYTALVPHVICEYLCHLSKLVMCCKEEVWHDDNLNKVWPDDNLNSATLCRATEVVMEKCFQLLGIGPSLGEWTEVFKLLVDNREAKVTPPPIAWSSADDRYGHPKEHPKSRIQILSMKTKLSVKVDVKPEFDGYVTGSVTILDTYRLAKSDGWAGLDPNDDCRVSIFNKEWYDNPVAIREGSYISLGDTTAVRAIPFSKFFDIELLIKVTNKEKTDTCLVCDGKHRAPFTDFWEKKSNTHCGTMEAVGENGTIFFYYIAIKDAVDTYIELNCDFKKKARLGGLITATFGEDVLGNNGMLGNYNAHIFVPDPNKSVGNQKLALHKSSLSVPVKSVLKFEVRLMDLDTNNQIIAEAKVDICEVTSLGGVSLWDIPCSLGSLKLTLCALTNHWMIRKGRGLEWKTIMKVFSGLVEIFIMESARKNVTRPKMMYFMVFLSWW